MNPGQFAYSQFCVMLERLEMGVVLVETAYFVIFRHISTKLGGKVYFIV